MGLVNLVVIFRRWMDSLIYFLQNETFPSSSDRAVREKMEKYWPHLKNGDF
jgi:hypothetical protein